MRRKIELMQGEVNEFMEYVKREMARGIDDWEQRLSTTALGQIKRLRTYFSTLRWWELVPDTGNELVTGGRGTEVTTDETLDVLDSDYVTAARTPDGRLAVVAMLRQHGVGIGVEVGRIVLARQVDGDPAMPPTVQFVDHEAPARRIACGTWHQKEGRHGARLGSVVSPNSRRNRVRAA